VAKSRQGRDRTDWIFRAVMACFQTRFGIARRAPRRGDPAGLPRRGTTPLLAMTGHALARRSREASRDKNGTDSNLA
jgi:hypothetical protein